MPESDQRSYGTEMIHEYSLVDVVNELRIVKEECRQVGRRECSPY